MIVLCTQVAHEGSDMTVYEVGHEMKKSVQCTGVLRYDTGGGCSEDHVAAGKSADGP